VAAEQEMAHGAVGGNGGGNPPSAEPSNNTYQRRGMKRVWDSDTEDADDGEEDAGDAEVGRCRLTVSNPELKARQVSTLEPKM
jgi:hypothetical protein